jgi:hypothetical protein
VNGIQGYPRALYSLKVKKCFKEKKTTSNPLGPALFLRNLFKTASRMKRKIFQTLIRH